MTSSRAIQSLVLLILVAVTHVNGQGAFLDACSSDTDCGTGLYCSNCPAAGAQSSRCTRDQTTKLTNITSLPFNKVSWLVTHNSYAIDNFPELTGPRATFTNQEDNVTAQLQNGVRGFMLDTYDFLNDVWLCHSFGGECFNFTAFEPLLNTLNDIETFMAANPSEIITLILEDYVTAPDGLTKVFKAANLTQYMFPVASMPTNGSDWPTIGTMIQNKWRLVVFTSKSAKQTTEGIAYEWNFLNENQYGDDGMVPGNCTNRAESKPLNSLSASLILQNFFRTTPLEPSACEDNSDPLYKQIPVCYAAAGDRWPNFIAVDFYKRSTGGGSFQAVDKVNGQFECGCNSSISCQNQTSAATCAADPSLAEYSSTFVPYSPASSTTQQTPGSNTNTSSSSHGTAPAPPPPVSLKLTQSSFASPLYTSGYSTHLWIASLVITFLMSSDWRRSL